MNYKDIYATLNEDATRLPPVHQSWHDFDREFFTDSTMDFKEFVTEYLDYYSSLGAFFRDPDNHTLRNSLDDMGIKFIQQLELCTGDNWSVIVEKLARCL